MKALELAQSPQAIRLNGPGRCGQIYLVDGKVVKVPDHDSPISKYLDIEDEGRVQNELAQLGVMPKVHSYDDTGIVMDYIPCSMTTVIWTWVDPCRVTRVLANLFYKLAIAEAHGIQLLDRKADNAVVDASSDTAYHIDAGLWRPAEQDPTGYHPYDAFCESLWGDIDMRCSHRRPELPGNLFAQLERAYEAGLKA